MSGKLQEQDVTRKVLLKDFANFMKQVLREPSVHRFKKLDRLSPHAMRRRVVESLPFVAAESTPKEP